MRASKRILIVEDEPGLVLTLTDRLKAEGYAVDAVSDGDDAVGRATGDSFDLIILDIMLPGKDGFDICQELRKGGMETPILFLTARGEITDKVVGLKLGGDDYLTKPFDMLELTARVGALLRRSPVHEETSPERYRFGDVDVDFRKAEVTRRGEPVDLSAARVQAPALLHREPGRDPQSRRAAEPRLGLRCNAILAHR